MAADVLLVFGSVLCGACLALVAVGHETYGIGFLSAGLNVASVMLRGRPS
jgi:hypothetical protein